MANRIGSRRSHHNSLPSTNTHAASFATDPANHGLVITADSQSAGRGQYDRSWSAPPGSSILMSALLFPPPEIRRAAMLTAWAAVSVCETIQRATGLIASIKWPNDVLIGEHKVCGILCEGGAKHVVAGIGLNVNQSREDFEGLGLPVASSLAVESKLSLQVPALIDQLISELDKQYARLECGEIGALEESWRTRIGLLGQDVIIERMDAREMRGRLQSMNFAGVEIALADGNRSIIAPEAIRHLKYSSRSA